MLYLPPLAPVALIQPPWPARRLLSCVVLCCVGANGEVETGA